MRRLNALTSSLILSSCAILNVAADTTDSDGVKSIPLRTHSLAPPYLDSDMTSRWWDFGGDTLIRADQYVRLASDVPSQSGYIFSKIPLTATNWEVEFEFSISGKGNLHGDGFAMWVVKDRAQQGPVFGGKDEFEGFGLFFDTYKNNRPGVVFPYVMGMMGDGKTQYDSANDGKANEMGGCSVSLNKPRYVYSERTTNKYDRREVFEAQASRPKPRSRTSRISISTSSYSTEAPMHGRTASRSKLAKGATSRCRRQHTSASPRTRANCRTILTLSP